MMRLLGRLTSWLFVERIRDYRDGRDRIYDATVKTGTQINQIILTASLASLAAVAALSKDVFEHHAIPSFIVVACFTIVILLSIVNLYLTTIVLKDMQRQLSRNWTSFTSLSKDMDRLRFEITRKTLNTAVLVGFCAGLVSFLWLLGLYILGGDA